MTPHRFRQVRKLYGQTQTQWAATLGYAGEHAYGTIYRMESARVKIPGPTAKLVDLLELMFTLREVEPENWSHWRPGQLTKIKAKQGAGTKSK